MSSLSKQDVEDITEALDYTCEDLAYRLHESRKDGGIDFGPEDWPELEAKIQRLAELSGRINRIGE